MNTAEQTEIFQTFQLYPAEREVFRKKEPLTPSERAEKYRIVTMGAHEGPWRNDISPHLPFIMDTWGKPHVREVNVVKSPQTGGTELMYNCEAYGMDRDPSTAMFIMPDQNMARKVSEDRIIPMIQRDLRIRHLISPNPDDTAKQRVKLRNGSLLYMGWSNSASALATFPIKRLYFDEVDKYPPVVKKEADPISLGEKRARTFRYTSKIFKVSTPTREDGPIWKALKRCDVEYRYHASCPDCGLDQMFRLDLLRYPEDTPPEAIERDNLARYECDGCHSQWTDRQKDKAVRAGKWRRVRGKSVLRPRRVGFHLPSWISPDVSLSEIAAAYIVSRTDRAKLIDFHNDYLAEPFIESEEGESVSEKVLYDRRQDYAPANVKWQVPMSVCVLTCFADVQKNRIEAEVTGWAPGYESWGIEYRAFPGDPTIPEGAPGSPWNDLNEYLKREWIHESGVKLRIAAAGVDSGYLAAEVYRFVRKRQARRVNAYKGSSARARPLVSVPSAKVLRKGTVKDRFRVNLITIGTETAKDTLLSWMEIEGAGPGYMHYHKGYSLDYFRMICSEHAVTRYDKAGRPYRVWEKKHPDARNEALDIRVGNYAVVDLLNPNFEKLAKSLKDNAKTTTEKPEDKPAPKTPRTTGRGRGGYVKGWKT